MVNTDRIRNRLQLAAFTQDQQALRALESLFDLKGLPTGAIIYGAYATMDGALPADGSAVSRLGFQALYNKIVPQAAVTITIASPGVVTWTAHGLPANTPIQFTTNGALPTGLIAGTVYYVKSPATNTFNVSATPGGAAINTTGTQSGVHTATAYPYGIGDGTTTFNVPVFPAVGGCNAFIIT